MTQIKIEVPANDHIALSAMANALQRIAAERTPSVTVGDSPADVKFENTTTEEQHNVNMLADVEIARMDEEFEASVQSENTKYDEEFDEVATKQDDTLDANGLPWDKRIHSRGKTRLSDDTWRLARKPNDKTDDEWSAYVESVKSELKAVQDIPTPVETVTSPTIEDVGYDASAPIDDNLTPPVVDETREGPFYWTHDESDSCGEVQTIEELHVMIEGDGHARQIDKESYDKRVEIGYDNGINNVTPPTAPTLTPPVTTTDTPVAPVTPPTSLTPPVVEPSDQPSVTTFQELMLYITGNAKKRGADNDMIKATLAEVDPALTAIPLIATRADLIPKFVTALEAKLS